MASIKSAIKVVKNFDEPFNQYYSMTFAHANEIIESKEGLYGKLSLAFNFGYIQALRAVRAEQRKAGKGNIKGTCETHVAPESHKVTTVR